MNVFANNPIKKLLFYEKICNPNITAFVFHNTATEGNVIELSGEVALCEACVEDVRREFIDENRDPNFIESSD